MLIFLICWSKEKLWRGGGYDITIVPDGGDLGIVVVRAGGDDGGRKDREAASGT